MSNIIILFVKILLLLLTVIGAIMLVVAIEKKEVLVQPGVYSHEKGGEKIGELVSNAPIMKCAEMAPAYYTFIKVALVIALIINVIYMITHQSKLEIGISGLSLCSLALLVRTFMIPGQDALVQITPIDHAAATVSAKESPTYLLDNAGKPVIADDGTKIQVFIKKGEHSTESITNYIYQEAVPKTDTMEEVKAGWVKNPVYNDKDYAPLMTVNQNDVKYYLPDILLPYDISGQRICHVPLELDYLIRPAAIVWLVCTGLLLLLTVVDIVKVQMKTSQAL